MVVFDLDDTLYAEAEFVDSGRRAVRRYLDALHSDIDIDGPWSAEMRDIYRCHKPSIHLYADAQEALALLKQNGISMGIITDGRHISQYNKFQALKLYDFIAPDNLIISEDIGAEKTSDEPFRTLMVRNPDEEGFVYIGDNPAKDFYHPNRLGWDTVMRFDINETTIHPQTLPDDVAYHPKHITSSIYEYISNLISQKSTSLDLNRYIPT